jgi:alpha-L-arabinofuranosidase
LSLFLLNRDIEQDMEVSIDVRGFGRLAVDQAMELRHDDLGAINDKNAPERVTPAALSGVVVDGGRIRVTLKPASWNVIHLTAH